MRRPVVALASRTAVPTASDPELVNRTCSIPGTAATTFSAEMDAFAFEHIFPRLGRVARSDEIALQAFTLSQLDSPISAVILASGILHFTRFEITIATVYKHDLASTGLQRCAGSNDKLLAHRHFE